MALDHDLQPLERRRSDLYRDLAELGDFRPGSLAAVRRRCGKPTCVCAKPDHPGHGPQHMLTKKVGGKALAVHLRPGPELEKVQREVATYKRFRALVDEVVEVNEQICEARPVVEVSAPAAAPGGGQAGAATRSRRNSRPSSPA